MCHSIRRIAWLHILLWLLPVANAGKADTVSATTAPAKLLSWTEIVRTAAGDASLKPAIDSLVKEAL